MKITPLEALNLVDVLPHAFASTCLETASNGVSLMLTNALTGFHLTMEWPNGQLMEVTPLRLVALFPDFASAPARLMAVNGGPAVSGAHHA